MIRNAKKLSLQYAILKNANFIINLNSAHVNVYSDELSRFAIIWT